MGLTPFATTPFLNFSDQSTEAKMKQAIEKVRSNLLGKDWPLYINGQEVTSERWLERYNPSDTKELIGRVPMIGKELAGQAVEAAAKAFKSWSKTPATERSRYLLRAAAIYKKRRFELNALIMLESGKTWPEADGDIAEAIDFLEFYARSMIEIDHPHPTVPYPGEENNVYWTPMGVTLSIPPWNFPLAILTGMTVAALVTGNTVVLKPSPKAPIMAAFFMQIMRELELPPGVLNLVQGEPEEIGDFLVEHPLVRIVSFTGSKKIGCRIYERAAKVSPGQKWLKRVIAEMGGKDAIIVDENYDLDFAADQIVAAAFGFQGQKCSACSRLIAHHKIHDQLLERVVKRTKELVVGPAWEKSSQVAAVVDDVSCERIMEYIEKGKQEATLVTGGQKAALENYQGWYIEPTIFKDVQPNHTIHCEEIFGPVLSVLSCKSVEDGLEIANSTEYGLTGALFSNKREHLEKARQDFHVGNLYLNRKCTGAFVGVQPFGGFNMSGTDDKAGSKEHLYRFLQAKTVSERL